MRRSVVFLLIVIACLLSACSSLGADVLLGRDIHFSAPQLQAQLDRKFPRDYRKLGGLVNFSLLNPRLTLPGGGRLQLEFDIGMNGPGGGARTRWRPMCLLRFLRRSLPRCCSTKSTQTA